MELTDEEYRAQAAQNIWGGKTELFKKEEEVAPVEQEKTEPEVVEPEDPFAGIDPAVKSFVEAQLGEVNNLKYRLSQAEKRVGSLQNELQNKPKHVEPPPPEKKEPEVNEDWERLKQEYPEDEEKFAAMEKVFAGKTAENIQPVDVEKIRAELQTDFNTRLTEQQLKAEAKLLKMFHPDFEKYGTDPDYNKWIKAQPPEVQEKANSFDAVDAKDVLDMYKSIKAPKTTNIQDQRDKRLNRAVETPRTGKSIKNKTVDDMTDEEYREYSAKKIFGR